MSEDDAEKREQERLMRTMNKVGARGRNSSSARPVSWNVNITGRAATGSLKKNEQAEALRLLQDQIKFEEVTGSSAEPPLVSPTAKPVTPDESPRAPEEAADPNAFHERRELDRIAKWTKGLGADEGPAKKAPSSVERPTPAVLLRQFAVEESIKAEETHGGGGGHAHHAEYVQGVTALHTDITLAAKALRQQNGEALARSCIAVVLKTKTLAGLVDDDTQILGWAKALEGTANMLRTRLDSGGDGHEYLNELQSSLGQLYISVLSLS